MPTHLDDWPQVGLHEIENAVQFPMFKSILVFGFCFEVVNGFASGGQSSGLILLMSQF